MNMRGACALVTGGSRGLGAALVEVLAGRGVRRIYASSRDAASARRVLRGRQVEVPITLDVTQDASVAAVAAQCGDVNLLINNAGYVRHGAMLGDAHLEAARLEMETNFWGMLRCSRAFSTILGANGGGMIVNILSIGALASIPGVGTYCASKAAALSLTQGLRRELAEQGTAVTGVILGPVLTDMARSSQGRHPADAVAENIVAALEQDCAYVFPDPVSQRVAAAFAVDPWASELWRGQPGKTGR